MSHDFLILQQRFLIVDWRGHDYWYSILSAWLLLKHLQDFNEASFPINTSGRTSQGWILASSFDRFGFEYYLNTIIFLDLDLPINLMIMLLTRSYSLKHMYSISKFAIYMNGIFFVSHKEVNNMWIYMFLNSALQNFIFIKGWVNSYLVIICKCNSSIIMWWFVIPLSPCGDL